MTQPRDTVAPLHVIILDVPHRAQRYNTCGDYYYTGDDNDVLLLKVSQLPCRREMLLVAIHELIEWALCEAEGISNEEIDKFDLEFEKLCFDGEPGDHIQAPYYHQHQIATRIERILAAEMNVDWLEYERHIEELSK